MGNAREMCGRSRRIGNTLWIN